MGLAHCFFHATQGTWPFVGRTFANGGQKTRALSFCVMATRALVLLKAGAVVAGQFDKFSVGRFHGPSAVLIQNNPVHVLLHVGLDPRVLAAQPVRARVVWHGYLAVILQRAVFEARYLAIVAIAFRHIPNRVCAHEASYEPKDHASRAHRPSDLTEILKDSG